MKRQFAYITALSLLIISCAGNQQQPTATPEVATIGYGIIKEGEKRPIQAGNQETIALWEAYIKAHNEQNLETINTMNAEGFKAYGPRGEVIDGREAHMAFLTQWFEASSPKWKSTWFMANTINYDDKPREWITSAHEITLQVEGQTINAVQIHDALIEDGKVKMFYVYERLQPEESTTP